MSGALHKSMVWLGLAYDDPRPEPAESEETPVERRAAVHVVEDEEHTAEVTKLPRDRTIARVIPAPLEEDDLRRITTVHPKNYNDAKTIGENFRDGTPVILNLTDLEDADAKRLVDFSAGLIFGLHGKIERVTNKVFLLSPATVEITSEEDEEELEAASRSFFNQS